MAATASQVQAASWLIVTAVRIKISMIKWFTETRVADISANSFGINGVIRVHSIAATHIK
jgi:hypothetical protein